MTFWLCLYLLGLSIDSGATPSLWSSQVDQLHQSLSGGQWYRAKNALCRLRTLDPQRYAEQQFDLTAAWIAEREKLWGSVYFFLERSGADEPWVQLDKMRALIEMGRPRLVLDMDDRFSGSNRRRHHALLAKALFQIGRRDEAIQYYKELATGDSSAAERLEAHYYLAALYYKRGQTANARAQAERLMDQWPASDEALYAILLQEQNETPDYLARPEVMLRFAMTAYRNRDFERADRYFEAVITRTHNRIEVDRARYLQALILLKEESPEKAVAAFGPLLPQLKGGRFHGPAAFQYARALLMTKRYEAVIAFCEDFWRNPSDPKWREECAKLLILALRSAKQYNAFTSLELRLREIKAGSELLRFYYRNGVVWARQQSKLADAQTYLEQYRRFSMFRDEKQEALLWQGLIDWDRGLESQALESWLAVATTEPNHYFGLAARELLHNNLSSGRISAKSIEKLPQTSASGTKRNEYSEMLASYHLAGDGQERAVLVDALRLTLPQLTLSVDYHDLRSDSKAHRYARIGRFDRAAMALEPQEVGRLEYHYLKARWFAYDQNIHASLYHAEILANAYPRAIPYELIPRRVQELVYPTGFSRIIYDKAKDYGVDPYLLLAIIREESRFNAQAKSFASARGLMQFIPATAREIAGEIGEFNDFSLPMLYDPQTSITLGARYVDKLMKNFQGVPLYAVAAYNAGEDAVRRWSAFSEDYDPILFVWDVSYSETKRYCQKVLRAHHHYTRVYQGDGISVVAAPEGLRASP